MSTKKTNGTPFGIIEKLVDTVRCFFSDEQKTAEADTKNSASVIDDKKKSAEFHRKLALDKDIPYDDRLLHAQKADAESDKVQAEAAVARETNERRSKRKWRSLGLGGMAAIAIGYILQNKGQSTAVEGSSPKLLPENKE